MPVCRRFLIRVFPFASRERAVILLLAAVLFSAPVGSAQASPQALTVWLSSEIAPSCEASTVQASLQADMETQLRSAGITVSRVHAAALKNDADCVPVSTAGHTTMAVHQCLALSQGVSLAPEPRDVTLATTWRKCQSYTCAGQKCEALMRSQTRELVNAFIADHPAPSAPPAPPDNPAGTAPAIPRLVLQLNVIY